MAFTDVSVWLAFLAGLASFLSPCVLTLVPAYIGYLGGRSASTQGKEYGRWITFSHGVAFVLGFSLVFVFLGVAASFLGGALYDLRHWIARIGGVLVVIFGLHLIGIFRIPFLEYDVRVQKMPDRKWGYLSSVMMGVIFSAGWSPCVGPILGAILTLALNGGSVSQGVLLLSAYSLGLAIPFLLAALGIEWVTTLLSKHGKVMRYVEIGMGVVMVIIGVMLATGVYETIASQFQFFWVDFGL
jgi:cytochrome c-type biogenesis protein